MEWPGKVPKPYTKIGSGGLFGQLQCLPGVGLSEVPIHHGSNCDAARAFYRHASLLNLGALDYAALCQRSFDKTEYRLY